MTSAIFFSNFRGHTYSFAVTHIFGTAANIITAVSIMSVFPTTQLYEGGCPPWSRVQGGGLTESQVTASQGCSGLVAGFERFSFAQGPPSVIDFNNFTVVQTRQKYSCALLSAAPFIPPQLNGGGRMAGPINTSAIELVSEVARFVTGVTGFSPRSG